MLSIGKPRLAEVSRQIECKFSVILLIFQYFATQIFLLTQKKRRAVSLTLPFEDFMVLRRLINRYRSLHDCYRMQHAGRANS